jgi:hypothetical protein
MKKSSGGSKTSSSGTLTSAAASSRPNSLSIVRALLVTLSLGLILARALRGLKASPMKLPRARATSLRLRAQRLRRSPSMMTGTRPLSLTPLIPIMEASTALPTATLLRAMIRGPVTRVTTLRAPVIATRAHSTPGAPIQTVAALRVSTLADPAIVGVITKWEPSPGQ